MHGRETKESDASETRPTCYCVNGGTGAIAHPKQSISCSNRECVAVVSAAGAAPLTSKETLSPHGYSLGDGPALRSLGKRSAYSSPPARGRAGSNLTSPTQRIPPS